MTQLLRSFLAIELPESNKEEIIDHIQRYRELTQSKIKWVTRENLHITLRFLGKFERSHVQQLNILLSSLLKTIPAFNLHIDRMGAFPNNHTPKVIWLGFDYPENLGQVYKHIEDCVVKLGYDPDDRPFSPHLTLGRVRRDLPNIEIRNIGQIIAGAGLNFQSEFIAERVTLFQSELTRDGPIYLRLFDVNLGANPSLC